MAHRMVARMAPYHDTTHPFFIYACLDNAADWIAADRSTDAASHPRYSAQIRGAHELLRLREARRHDTHARRSEAPHRHCRAQERASRPHLADADAIQRFSAGAAQCVTACGSGATAV